jgi:hypothetical protein
LITFVRTSVAKPGKHPELLAHAKEIASVVKRASGTEVSVGNSLFGTPGEIVWTSNYDSLAQLEERATRISSSAEYTAMLKKGEDLIVAGTTRDHIWRLA